MLKNLYAELGAPPPAATAEAAPARHALSRRPAVRATIRPTRRSSRAAASTKRARKRKPGISNSILPNAASTMWSATVSASIRPMMPRWSRPCSPRSTRRRISRSADAPCARRSPTASRCRRRRTCCSSSFPISPAASARQKAKALAAGQRPRRRRRDARRAGGACRNSPASGPTRKPSSSRSIPCSRASIRSPRRSNAIPAASRSRSMRCATRWKSARGSASPRRSSPAASSPATRSRSMCRRRSTSRCRPIRTSRSS